MTGAEPTLQMALTFVVIAGAIVVYVSERVPLELTSLAVICVLLVLFQVLPVMDGEGHNRLAPERLLEGFANPALIAVLALLVVGDGLVCTGALDQAAQLVFRLGGTGWHTMALVLVVVVVVSAFLNNIPVVVIFIPIVHALARRLGDSPSALMMPLSFAAILGGMTTLIGSSTNLLVSSELVEVGEAPFGFFDFTVPGLVMAAIGLVYVIGVAPRLLPRRPARELAAGEGRQFMAELVVGDGSRLVGAEPLAGYFPALPEMAVRLIRRGERTVLPPFEDITLAPGDRLVVAATRRALTEAMRLGLHPAGGRADAGRARSGFGDSQRLMHAEAMVTPSSRLIGRTLEDAHFHDTHHCTVLGIRRRSRMVQAPVHRIPLEAGDVLLLEGHPEDIRALRADPEVLLMEWSAADLPTPHHARRALLVFAFVVVAAATGALPIAVAALIGAGLMIASGVLSVNRAAHALDRKVIMMIAAALALGAALQETGGAHFLAATMIAGLGDAGPPVVLSAFFLLVAALSNVISTKACAVLFTPIAVGIGRGLGVDPAAFAVAVVFAANCSFASPIGYQTNLLVMTPGQYRFADFVRAGLPLIVLLWVAFSVFAPWYFGLW